MGNYNINFDNKPYVDAIARYNQKVLIHWMYECSTKRRLIEDWDEKTLGDFLTHFKPPHPAYKVNIEYYGLKSSSLYKVFPEVIARDAQRALARSKRTEASDLLAEIVYDETLSPVKYGKGSLGLVPKAMTRADALNLLLEYPCSGAIELPTLKTILFEYQSICCYLTYGEAPRIGHMNLMEFDLDDGFIFHYSLQITPAQKNIKELLQIDFDAWKASDYTGVLFSADRGLNFDGIATVLGIVVGAGTGVSSDPSSLVTESAEVEKALSTLLMGEEADASEDQEDESVTDVRRDLSVEDLAPTVEHSTVAAASSEPRVSLLGPATRKNRPAFLFNLFVTEHLSSGSEESSIVGEITTIGIEAGPGPEIDFKAMDSRIKSSGLWAQSCPAFTSISFPTYAAVEIVRKLRSHPAITGVDGKLTEHGKEFQRGMSFRY